VNQREQYFGARIYFELTMIGGGHDADLTHGLPEIVPPAPTRRPNGAWYLDRILVLNARETTVLEKKVRRVCSVLTAHTAHARAPNLSGLQHVH
jgi:hypothetical protein